jgi:hypothetical protein
MFTPISETTAMAEKVFLKDGTVKMRLISSE